MIFRRFLIYIVTACICLSAGFVYAQDSAVNEAEVIVSDLEQNVEQVVLTDHMKAVEYARGGDLIAAYSYIQKAYHENSEDPKIFADYIVISTWMGKYSEAVSMYERHPEFELPEYAVEEIIKSLREVGRYEDTIALAENFLLANPKHMDVSINLIYSLIQVEQYQSALDRLMSIQKTYPNELRFDSLQSLLYASQKKWSEFFDTIRKIKASSEGDAKNGVLSDMNEGFYLVYDEAILFARNGQFEEALNLLDHLDIFEHKSQQVQMDRIVVYIWQEEFEKALAAYQKMDIQHNPPPYFLKEVARAYKKGGEQFSLSDQHFKYISPYIKEIEEIEYESRVRLAFIRSYVEEGNIEKALSLIDDFLEDDPKNQEVLFLKAEIYEKTGEYWRAVKIYNQILAIDPDNHAALNLKLRSLMDLGATSLALEEAEKNTDIVDQVVVERARTNVPMYQIRWEEPKLALEKIEQLEAEYTLAFSDDQPEDENSEHYWRVQWDRFLALRQEQKMEKIVEEYEILLTEDVAIPPWVHQAAADAYLYLEKPEEALAIFNELLEVNQSFQLQMSAYYTYVELGQYKEAQVVLDLLDRETPAKIVERGILKDNWRKADIVFNKAWLLMYQDRLREAEKCIKDIKKIAPFNTNLRMAEAYNHRYRGWKRQALQDFKILRTLDNKVLSTHIGYAGVLNENMEKEQAREEAKMILEKDPLNKHGQRLQRAFDVEEMSTVTVSASYTIEFPGDDELTVSLRGDHPIDFHHNLFAEVIRRETQQEGDNDIARKIRVGDEWQINNNWRLVGALTGDYEKTDDVGFLGQLRFQPDDYWTFDLGYESNTLEIASRSRKDGVEADLYTLSSTYRASEMFNTTLGTSNKDFTDDNQYFNYFWRTDTAIITSAYWKMRLGTEFSYETFSKQDVNYFSPEEVYSCYLVPMVEHTWFRRYDKFWVDRMYFGIGKKWQKDYSSSGVGFISYEQEHAFSDTKSWLIGIAYNMNQYDSEGVNSLNIYTTLRSKF